MIAAGRSPSGGQPAVAIEGLTKRYGGRAVLDGITLQVAAGETFALLGPNGAGKTTMVEILEGYRRPDGGTVHVLGADPDRAGRDHRARVGLMLQGGGGLDPRLEAREALGLFARLHARPRDPDEVLDLVGLRQAARTRFRRLSGGERQRLGVALALVGRPELVILDEPTAGMDVEARRSTVALLGRLRDEGLTIILTSHELVDVERLADRIAIIDRGTIVAAGRPGELVAGGRPAVRFRLRAPLPTEALGDLEARLREVAAGVTIGDEGGGQYRVIGTPPTPDLVAALTAWCAARRTLVTDLRTGGGSLEERYLELVGVSGPP